MAARMWLREKRIVMSPPFVSTYADFSWLLSGCGRRNDRLVRFDGVTLNNDGPLRVLGVRIACGTSSARDLVVQADKLVHAEAGNNLVVAHVQARRGVLV